MTVVASDLLTAQRADLRERIDALEAEIEGLSVATVDSNGDDEHDPEGSTIAFERSQLQAVLDQAIDQLGEVDAAVERVAADAYGTCERCEKPIADERLTALPSARYCIDCAALLERTA